MKLAERLKITNSEDAGGTRKFNGGLDRVISVIAIAMTVYHLYVAIFGLPEWLVHRPLHVAFFLCLGFLMYRGSKKKDRGAGIVIDLILAASAVFVYIYILMNFERLSRYMFMVTKLTAMDYFVIVLTFLLILEITRRTTGWSIIIVAAVFLLRSCTDGKTPDPAPGGIVYDPGAVEGGWNEADTDKIVDALNEKVEQGMINISMNTTPTFQNGSSAGNLMIVNESVNNYPQVVEIHRNDTGEVIYKSGAIPVGSKLETAKLSADLDAGTYECTALFYNVDPDSGEYLGCAGAVITVTVLE